MNARSRLAGHLLAGFSLLALLTSPSIQAQPDNLQLVPATVYRIDPRPPEDVFANGFNTNGQMVSLLAHAIGSSCDAEDPAHLSAWISTTTNREQAIEFAREQLRHNAIPQQALGGASGLWVYAIATDHTYLSVISLFMQAEHSGRNNLGGYTTQHADQLEYLIYPPSTLLDDAEVVSQRIATTNIFAGALVTLDASTGLVDLSRPRVTNANYRAPVTQMNNAVRNLTYLVPPSAIALYAAPGTESCYLACDGASASGHQSHRERRSLSLGSLSCAAKPNLARALIGSEDD
ncbi:hypothetical protein ACVW0Y_001157 [Pseudomonas sp. TE3786]